MPVIVQVKDVESKILEAVCRWNAKQYLRNKKEKNISAADRHLRNIDSIEDILDNRYYAVNYEGLRSL